MPYEILVHISAPTTKDDDDRYRREALAYRNFKPARTIYLDGRDGQTVVPTFQHPRHHALQHEQPRQIHWNPRKTRRSNSLNEIEPNWSNSAPDTIGTQVILDTQRSVGAFDSQISFITNSTYDGEPMSWDEQQPAKRPRTAKSIEDDSSSGHHRGAVPASYPSSPNKSPYARVTSFPGLDPASSLLPDSYGLSKSGGTNSIRRLEEAANTMRMSPFPASLQNSGIDVSRSYRPSEETAAAAVLLGLRAEGNQANSNISTFNPPSRVFSPAVDVTSARAAVGSVGELLQNRANTPEHRMLGSSATSPSHSTHDEHAHRNGAKTALTHSHPFAGLSLSQNAASSTPRPTDPIQQNNATRNGGTTTSSPSDVARKGSLRREAQPDHVRSRSNETGKMWASTAPLPVSNRNSPRLAPLFSAISRTQNSPEVNEFHHEVHPTRADEGMSDVDMEDQEIDEDETQNERSTSHAEEMITEYQEENQFVARQAPILSLAEKSELASSTKNGRIRLDDGVALEIRRQQPVGNLVDLISPEPKHRPFRCTVVDCGMAYQDKSGLNYHKEV
jgi:hypothetical protein